jgi:hypothetical protein
VNSRLARFPPGAPLRPWSHDDAVVALGHEERARRATEKVLIRVTDAGRVSMAEVARPTAQEGVDLLHDRRHGHEQPRACGDLPQSVASVLHRLTRGQRAGKPMWRGVAWRVP